MSNNQHLAQDEREIIGVERYRVVRHGGNFGVACVTAGDGERTLYRGRISDCERVAAELATAFEDGKFVATRPAQTEQRPVAWVEVKNRHEGPYEFHGIELLDSGKHYLYATPIAQTEQQPVAGGYVLLPLEPTENMLDALHNGGHVGDDKELREFYQSLLSAAPIAQTAPQPEQVKEFVEACMEANSILDDLPWVECQRGETK